MMQSVLEKTSTQRRMSGNCISSIGLQFLVLGNKGVNSYVDGVQNQVTNDKSDYGSYKTSCFFRQNHADQNKQARTTPGDDRFIVRINSISIDDFFDRHRYYYDRTR